MKSKEDRPKVKYSTVKVNESLMRYAEEFVDNPPVARSSGNFGNTKNYSSKLIDKTDTRKTAS